MREYIDVTGKNEEEAISKALAQLGLDRDDVSVEILERAKSGFLGLGSCPAKVRVSYGPEEEEPAPVESAPVQEKTEQPAAKSEPRKNPEKRSAPKAEKKADKPVREKPVQEKSAPEQSKAQPQPVSLGEEVDDEKAQAIRTFLSGLLSQMESNAQVKVYLPEKGRYRVILEGENLGALIGRRGETLDAIQQLTNYSVNRGQSKRVRIHVDAEGYRAKREESLQRLAVKVAGKVVKYRKNMTLEPMNAYERHVIHAALQDYPNVTTYSTGVEPNRRTVVAYAPGQK